VCLDVGCQRTSGTNECEREVPKARRHLPFFIMLEERRRPVGNEGMAMDGQRKKDGEIFIQLLRYLFDS